MLEGIDLQNSPTGSFCFAVSEISEDLKKVIRERLSEICNGAASASRKTVIYSYQHTLSSFFERFDTKPLNTTRKIYDSSSKNGRCQKDAEQCDNRDCRTIYNKSSLHHYWYRDLPACKNNSIWPCRSRKHECAACSHRYRKCD